MNIPDDTFANIFNPTNSNNGPNSKGKKLENAYGSLDKVDLWVGIIGEK